MITQGDVLFYSNKSENLESYLEWSEKFCGQFENDFSNELENELLSEEKEEF